MTEAQIKHMVNRFLGWRLPADFTPDAGISFKAAFNEGTQWPMKHEPSGTNLFTATQADAMVRHMLEGMSPDEGNTMKDPRFLQDGFDKRLSHLIEECGELLAAAGKTQRWGVWSHNPLLAPKDQESNFIWLRREMADVRQALDRLDQAIEQEFD